MKLRTILGAGASATALVCASAFAQDRSWTGSAGDGKWSTPDNWLGVTAPANGDAVSFGEALGGTLALDMDIANLSLLSLGYISGAGSYTVSGGALGITSALTSDASAVQTISAPVNLGAANAGSVTVGGVGAIDLTGVTSFQGKELVKTGTGVFTTTDGAVYGPQKITVKGGTFKIGARASAYADGSKYYPGSLSGDAGNPTLLWRDTQLSDVVGVSARPATTTMGLGSVMCPFFWKNDGTTATVQFKKAHEGGRYIMTVFVSFKQDGPHVYAYASAAKYSTESSSSTGVARASSPLGDFVLQKNNPVFLSSEGVVTGTAHGSVACDEDGEWWYFYTVHASIRHQFERRIGMDLLRLTRTATSSLVRPRPIRSLFRDVRGRFAGRRFVVFPLRPARSSIKDWRRSSFRRSCRMKSAIRFSSRKPFVRTASSGPTAAMIRRTA